MILVPTADHPYYLWQMLVQAYAMRGYDVKWLVYCPSGRPSKELQVLQDSGQMEIHSWPDWKRDMTYNANMKPWLVGKYLENNPTSQMVLVIDPDVILTGNSLPFSAPTLLIGTDTDSYTGPGYLQSKNAWYPLCDLVGVDPELASGFPGIGAQYIFEGIPGYWWEDVAKLSISAFKLLSTIPAPEGHEHPVQAWCAEMYVTQLMAIRDNIAPHCDPQMNMVWADDSIHGWETAGFFHDAGVPHAKEGSFCKITHQRWPKDIPRVDSTRAAARYVELIRETEAALPALTSALS